MVTLSAFPLCCGASILNNFGTGSSTVDPNGVSGYKTDGVNYVRDEKGNLITVTYADKFKADLARLRLQFPNRMYCCILNQAQYDAHNKGWPKLLKEVGFEFVRSWSNSNHDGSHSYGGEGPQATRRHPNYLFVLCTDDKGTCKDFTQPPKGWDELPVGVQPATAEIKVAA